MAFVDSDDSEYLERSREKIARIYNVAKRHANKACIENLLREEGDINCRIPKGRHTVPNLLFFAHSMNIDTFNLLLENGADFTSKNFKGRTVVHEIVRDKIDELLRMTGNHFENDYIDAVLSAHVRFNNFTNASDENGFTHFHVACMMNNAAVVEFFLKNGVNVNQAVSRDSTIFPQYSPLHLAVKYACPESVQVLLKHGANVFLKNIDGLSSMLMLIDMSSKKLSKYCSSDYKRTLDILLKHAVNDPGKIDVADEFGFCYLHAACIHQDDSFVVNILKNSENIDQPVNFDSPIFPGYTALHFAAFSNVKIFKLLLKNGVDINAKNAMGETPLDLCLQKYSAADIHSIILEKPEWKNITLSDNKTKLVNVVAALANVSSFNSFYNRIKTDSINIPCDSPLWPGYTLLHLAVIFINWNFEEIAERLLNRRDSLLVKDARGSTALHLAFYMRKYDFVQYMLDDYNIDDNPVDRNNLSYFHIACAVGHQKAVEHFLSIGVDVDSPVLSTFECAVEQASRGQIENVVFIHLGSTSLHINVSCGGHNGIIKQLLKHGAIVNAQDVYGFTPVHRLLTCASYRIHNPIVRQLHLITTLSDVLLSAENLINCVSNGELSHLHVASYFGHREVVQKLIEMGADVNALVTFKGNPRRQYSQHYLLDSNEVLNFLSNFVDYTPLHFAMLKKNDTVSFILINNGADFCLKNAEGVSFLNYLSDSKNRDEIAINAFKSCTVMQRYFEDKFGMTKLHLACCTTDLKLVMNSISQRVNVNAKIHSESPIWQGYTPLHVVAVIAFQKGVDDKLKEIVKFLIKNGADLAAADDNNDTPLHLQVKNINYCNRLNTSSVVNFLFGYLKNYNVNPADLAGLTFFHIACVTQNVAVIENFLKHGVDVNQAVSYFSYFNPGSTALHLAIEHYKRSKSLFHRIGFGSKTVLQIVDKLLQYGANVNAADVLGNTPLIASFGYSLRDLRRILIPKLISSGAQVHTINLCGQSVFECLLTSQDVTWEEIEIFFRAGCHWNVQNPITQELYITKIFDNHRKNVVGRLNNKALLKIIDYPQVTQINNQGQTSIHSVIYMGDTNMPEFAEIIEQLIIRGCYIDHQDIKGQSALHLAVKLGNCTCISVLLKNGADVNLIDNYGKTAHGYASEIFGLKSDLNRRDVLVEFATHVHKLQLCRLRVNELTRQLQEETLRKYPLESKEFDSFKSELEKTRDIQIGTTSLSLYEFLTCTDMGIVYVNMTNEERKEVNQFFKKISKYNFREIAVILKLKYRETVERMNLIEPALESLNILTKYQLPDLCCRNIMNFLKNEELKRLIASGHR